MKTIFKVSMGIWVDNQYFHNDDYSEGATLGSSADQYIIIIITIGYIYNI